MNSNEIVPGKEYALRESRNIYEPFQHIKVTEHIRGNKWRVEWIDPNKGLIDYVKSIAIICPWGERKKVAKDEQSEAKLKDDASKDWPGNNHPLDKAVSEVLSSTGENIDTWKGILSGEPDALDRVADRAGYEWPSILNGYIDRFGKRHYPWRIAIELAKAFAAAEPQTVLLHIEATEKEWSIEARYAGEAHLVSLLEEYRAGWAVVRQWASFDAERNQLNEEIERLRRVINETVWKLRSKDMDPERLSRWLERSLKGR